LNSWRIYFSGESSSRRVVTAEWAVDSEAGAGASNAGSEGGGRLGSGSGSKDGGPGFGEDFDCEDFAI
jgi:hypothetical protein